MTMTATYSPDDNKLRLYSSTRLDSETFERVKAHGFKWAPRQQLFVAPMWTPGREDLLIELCGEIGDDDSSLVARAEERAERFEEYSDKRASDAESARKAVDAIAERFAFGQPILVGHHSERSARRDKERIDAGMRKAVKMWETSSYWTDRAAGAIAHAKYKESPAVRHRRIKGIESDRRKAVKGNEQSAKALELWTRCANEPDAERQKKMAIQVANVHGFSMARKEGDREDFNQTPSAWGALQGEYPNLYAPRTVAEVIEAALRVFPRSIARVSRWIAHYDNRLAYERAMLADQLGAEQGTQNAMAERFALAPGGRVQTGRANGEWLTILRVNRSNGVVNSVTTTAPAGRAAWSSRYKIGVEEIRDYEAPSAETTAKAKAATKLPPLCNYPGEGFAEMTTAEYEKVNKNYRGYRPRKATATAGAHRTRSALGVFALRGKADDNRRHAYIPVFLTDAKRVDPPAPIPPSEPTKAEEFVAEFVAPPSAAEMPSEAVAVATDAPSVAKPPVTSDFVAPSPAADFEAMRQTLRNGGVQVVVAPQLFPTPAAIAREVVAMADVSAGERVLEPSAGTGALLRAVFDAMSGAGAGRVVAVEINHRLAEGLRLDRSLRHGANESNYAIHCADFLETTPAELGTFHRVVMNPPFENGADIRHILHARQFLKPGGRLVAICANGPRQRDKLMSIATHWQDLPAGSFKETGTNVNTAIVVIDGPSE